MQCAFVIVNSVYTYDYYLFMLGKCKLWLSLSLFQRKTASSLHCTFKRTVDFHKNKHKNNTIMQELEEFLHAANLAHLGNNMIEQGVTLDVLLIANDHELSLLTPKVVEKIKLRAALQKHQNKSLPDDSVQVKSLERQTLIYMPDDKELTSLFGSNIESPPTLHSMLPDTAQKANEPIQELNTEVNVSLASPGLDESNDTTLIITSTPERANNSIVQDWDLDLRTLESLNGRSLRQLLMTETIGRLLVAKADNGEKLNSRDRAFIVKLIVETELRALNEISVTIRKNIWQDWATEVVSLFKGESTAIYYVPYHVIGGKVIQASGLFHNRLITHRRLLGTKKRKSSSSESSDSNVGCCQNNQKRVRPLPESFRLNSPNSLTVESNTVSKDCLDWLQASSSPQDLVAAKWLATFDLRNKQLSEGLSYKNYFNRFLALKLPTGHDLLSLDFERVYPNANKVFQERFPIVKSKILTLLAEKASSARPDQTCLDLLNLATVGEEQASLAAFLAIISLLRQMPTICVPRKKVWKLSKEEVLSSFIGHVVTASDIDRYCADREALVAAKGIPEQPYIVAVGSSWATVTHYEDDGVFPEDCISFMECIPALSLAELQEGALIVVKVGEVYSPSHFWLMRVGEEYDVALCELMNQMAKYYGIGEGKHRRLEWGAIAVGHYCAALYDREWHRALIVRRVTSYTVKVRYVDYGTVDTVAIESLKPLLRCYAELPVQAVRARLGGLRPWAGASRWPITATKQLLKLVYEARFFAKIVAIDRKEDILETFLIDTSTSNDVCLSRELIRGQHADARADSALRAVECYLFPHFEALEKGATPNYGDIRRYLRGGIKLDSVEDYYRYVPRSLSLLRSQSAPNLASPAPTPPTSLRPLPRALPVAGGGVTLAEADFTLPVAGGGVTLAEADCTVPVAGGK